MLPGFLRIFGALRIGVFGDWGLWEVWFLPWPCVLWGLDLLGTSCGPRARHGCVPTLPFSPMKPRPQDTRVSCPQNILVSLSPLRPCAPQVAVSPTSPCIPGGPVPTTPVCPRSPVPKISVWPCPQHARVSHPHVSCPRVALSPHCPTPVPPVCPTGPRPRHAPCHPACPHPHRCPARPSPSPHRRGDTAEADALSVCCVPTPCPVKPSHWL